LDWPVTNISNPVGLKACQHFCFPKTPAWVPWESSVRRRCIYSNIAISQLLFKYWLLTAQCFIKRRACCAALPFLAADAKAWGTAIKWPAGVSSSLLMGQKIARFLIDFNMVVSPVGGSLLRPASRDKGDPPTDGSCCYSAIEASCWWWVIMLFATWELLALSASRS